MINQQLLFKTQLVDGSRFRKYRKYLLWSGPTYTVIVISIHVFGPRPSEFEWSFLSSAIAIIFYAAVVASLILYYYSKRKIPAGNLEISEDHIKIEKDEINAFKIDDLEKLEIERGATHHYRHQLDNELIDYNNYLRFNKNGKSYEFEFCIDSKQKNEAFENMIHTLQKNRVKLYYTSI